MSRIGKKTIAIPAGVEVSTQGQSVKVRGPKGELAVTIPFGYRVAQEENAIAVHPGADSKPALWGTTRALLANAVSGVSKEFEKKLEIEGIGYQARLEGDTLVVQAGFTHPVLVKALPGIAFVTERNVITVRGIDKQRVGQVAAEIRAIRKPEPYKGKGIRYQGEVIRRKAGKKAVSAA